MRRFSNEGSAVPDYWRPSERYIGRCCRCGQEMLKKHMATLSARVDSYHPLKTIGHFCPSCYSAFLEEYEISE